MDALKRFIDKKKSEAKFKKAGKGHRLNESSGGAAASSSRPQAVQERQHPSKSSQLAGAAALARHEQLQQQQTKSNRSLAVIRAQALKELEAEKAGAAAATEGAGSAVPAACRTTELQMAPNLAVSGVFYKCPIIGPEVLPRAEIEQKLKEFLYEQLLEDGGIAACLIIHSCNRNPDKVKACVETLCKYLDNIIAQPEEEKYRKIRQSNRVFSEKVAAMEGAAEFLHAAGMETQLLPHGDTEEKFWVLPPTADIEKLKLLRDALLSAEPILPELDRNARALMPAQVARNVALPPDFFAVSQEELKREMQLKAELVDDLTTLQTREMRERAKQREVRKYRFCLIRIRFPDGITLQGTFRVLEPISALYTFVRENLVSADQPFTLVSPTGEQLDPEDHTSLADARLVPSVLLTWQPKCAAGPTGGSTQAYLIPELMETLEELG